MIDKKKIESLRAEWAGLMGRHTVFELLDEIERLHVALRQVEPYCREPVLVAVDDHCTWTVGKCRVCSAEFVRGFGEHKRDCPFFEET